MLTVDTSYRYEETTSVCTQSAAINSISATNDGQRIERIAQFTCRSRMSSTSKDTDTKYI